MYVPLGQQSTRLVGALRVPNFEMLLQNRFSVSRDTCCCDEESQWPERVSTLRPCLCCATSAAICYLGRRLSGP